MGSGMSRSAPVSAKNKWQKMQLQKNQAYARRYGGPKIEGFIRDEIAKLNRPNMRFERQAVKHGREFIRAIRTLPNGARKANMYTQQLNAAIKRRNARAAAAASQRP